MKWHVDFNFNCLWKYLKFTSLNALFIEIEASFSLVQLQLRTEWRLQWAFYSHFVEVYFYCLSRSGSPSKLPVENGRAKSQMRTCVNLGKPNERKSADLQDTTFSKLLTSLSTSSRRKTGFLTPTCFRPWMIRPGIEPMYVLRCPRISDWSETPPSAMLHISHKTLAAVLHCFTKKCFTFHIQNSLHCFTQKCFTFHIK